MRSPDAGIINADFLDSAEALNRPARVKKVKSYEEEESETPLPSKKKKKLSHNKTPDPAVLKTKKISFFDPKNTGHTEENQAQQVTSLVKRPRGRPPLVMNKAKSTAKPTVLPRPTISVTVPINLKSQFSQQVSSLPKHLTPSVQVGHLNPPPLETEVVKSVRPSITLITERVISKLMTSDPLSVADLVARLPDAPREIIQSALDVLQVMGIAMAVKTKDSGDTVSVQISNSSSVNLYALTGYARTHSAVKLCAVAEDTALKVEQLTQTRIRMTALQELTLQEGMTGNERAIALTALLDRFLLEEPRLWDDPLYRAILEHTGNVYHPPLLTN
jgi:hypothetical protein